MARAYKYMQKNELDKILSELYQLDPTLQEHEKKLLELISRMSDLRPDTRFDAAFAARLKAELLKQSGDFKKPVFSWALNKKIYITASVLALMIIAVVLVWPRQFGPIAPVNHLATGYQSKTGVKNVAKMSDNNAAVTKLVARAFGSLSKADNMSGAESVGTVGISNPSPTGLGSGATVSSIAPSAVLSNEGTVSNISSKADARMIAPMFNFKYVYKGEALNLSETQGDVYRRVKGSSKLSQELAQLVSGVNYTDFDLASFKNLKMTSLSLVEDKDKGLMINFDFNEDSIYIGENWEKWRITERESCGANQQCWDAFRLKIDDVPADKDLIALADKFISNHKINIEHYGSAIVDNSWRTNYDNTADKENFYVPEYATVIYPLLVNGEAVRDQNGAYAGLRVTINLLKKAASGLSGLNPYRYESSVYDLTNSDSDVIAAAEKGGANQAWFGSMDKTEIIELGTPTRAYVQLWQYTNNRNDELLVPALIFPIIKVPAGNLYFSSRSVVVPLVKEMLDEILKNSNGSSGGGVMPMMR